MDTHKFFLLGLLCCLHVSVTVFAVYNNCGDLKVYGNNGTTEFQISVGNCTLFSTDVCKSGSTSFPNGLGNGLSVEKPGNFTVKSFLDTTTMNNEVFRVSRLKFYWNGPFSGNGRQDLKGFYLNLLEVGSGNLKCRLFDLQNNNFVQYSKLRFEFELFPLVEHATYIVDMFSLPPPTEAERENGLYGRNIISLPGNSKIAEMYPKTWTTTIRALVYKEDGVLEVGFSLPEVGSISHFDSYRVQLVLNGTSNPLKEEYVKMTGQGGEAVHNFTNIPDGTYYIQVLPSDPFLYDNAKCLCYGPSDLPGLDRRCGSCTFTQTKLFNITGMQYIFSQPATTTPRSTSSSTQTPVETTQSQTSDIISTKSHDPELLSDGEIAAIIIVPVTLSVVVVIVIILRCKAYGLKTTTTSDANDNSNINNNNNNNNPIGGSPKPPKETCTDLKVPSIKKKQILLLASEDHTCFNKAVEKFADFLEYHCQCAVIYAPQQMVTLRKANSYCWLSGYIDTADFVVIVTSEAAYRLYAAYQKGLVYKDADDGPQGDLFTIGIKHICGKIAQGQDVSKVIMVHFEHTNTEYRLPIEALPNRLYHLPNHLPSFLRHIHHLDSTKMDLSKVNLPLQGNVPELVEGKDWLQAVNDSKTYEQKNPAWFDNKFGRPSEAYPAKPDFIKQGSCDSGYPPSRPGSDTQEGIKRQLSSVSMNEGDIHCLNNEAFCKEQFEEPSTVNSVYTIPYSTFTDATRPPEIDCSSTTSELLRRVNENYDQLRWAEKQEHLYNYLCYPQQLSFFQEGMQVFRDDTLFPSHVEISMPLEKYVEQSEGECISVYSAQSV